MNLKQLHTYLGQLLDSGVAPESTVAALTDEWPSEVTHIQMLEGGFDGDPSPQLAVLRSEGKMLLLLTVREDAGDLLSGTDTERPTHTDIELPVEQPYKVYGQTSDT